MSEFVLDAESNPHPKMLAGAVSARRRAVTGETWAEAYWQGYLAAMADATGCTDDELEAWMDSHQ